ncbi:unnamed protein product [Allacma fusca]|uniref:C2H2-type domain-containing protein n=1 Tax=Allacma fusca TaxID=39272 RepID=A0A8J2MAR5_9HEXA|nr:unnamed protein product [Allacma fusca]
MVNLKIQRAGLKGGLTILKKQVDAIDIDTISMTSYTFLTERLRDCRMKIEQNHDDLLEDVKKDLPFSLFKKFARAFKKETMEKRKTRVAAVKAKGKSVKKSKDKEKFVDLQPNFEIVSNASLKHGDQGHSYEPLVVSKTSSLPLCAADQNTPVHWYLCGRCKLLLNSKEMMDLHRQTHRNSGGTKMAQRIDSVPELLKEPATDIANANAEEGHGPFKMPPLPQIAEDRVSVSIIPGTDVLSSIDSSSSNKISLDEQVQDSSGVGVSTALRDSIFKRGSYVKKALDGHSSVDDDDTPYDDCELPDFSKAPAFRHLKTHLNDDCTLTKKSNGLTRDSRLRSKKSSTIRYTGSIIRADSVARRSSTEKINLNSYSPMSP